MTWTFNIGGGVLTISVKYKKGVNVVKMKELIQTIDKGLEGMS